jgi:hypothetical protein
LFVAATEVLERHLIGMFADDIREDLELGSHIVVGRQTVWLGVSG